MKTYEKRILRDLLEKAAETFSNHGCNDFSFEYLSDEETSVFSQEVNNVMDMDYDASNKMHIDWILMEYFAEQLHRSIECDKIHISKTIEEFFEEEKDEFPNIRMYFRTSKSFSNSHNYCSFSIYGHNISEEQRKILKTKLLQKFPYAYWREEDDSFIKDEQGALIVLIDHRHFFEVLRV